MTRDGYPFQRACRRPGSMDRQTRAVAEGARVPAWPPTGITRGTWRRLAVSVSVFVLLGVGFAPEPAAAIPHPSTEFERESSPTGLGDSRSAEAEGGSETASAPGRTTSAGDPAKCGPNDRPETGLQGQVPLQDQLSGRAAEGYFCNVRLVGQNRIENRGSNAHLAWWKSGRHTCAYVSTLDRPADDPLTGVAVIDITNPESPTRTTVLRDPGTRNVLETIQAESGILIVKGHDEGGRHQNADKVAIYDVSQDCRQPQLQSVFHLPKLPNGQPSESHGGVLSDDGKTLYAITFGVTEPHIRRAYDPDHPGYETYVIDLADPANPQLLTTFEHPLTHDMDIRPDGKRVYLGNMILDTTSIQNRSPNPEMRLVGTVDGMWGHTVRYAKIRGREYLLANGETFKQAVCTNYETNEKDQIQIFDITDETAPELVSGMTHQTARPLSRCLETATTDQTSYHPHYANVDKRKNASIYIVTWFGSGTRIFDIRDVENPKEIAYYNSGTKDTADVKWRSPVLTGLVCGPVVDCATAYPHYNPYTGHLLTHGVASGLLILDLAPDLKKRLGVTARGEHRDDAQRPEGRPRPPADETHASADEPHVSGAAAVAVLPATGTSGGLAGAGMATALMGLMWTGRRRHFYKEHARSMASWRWRWRG